jgi:hypothetical protein
MFVRGANDDHKWHFGWSVAVFAVVPVGLGRVGAVWPAFGSKAPIVETTIERLANETTFLRDRRRSCRV